MGFVVTGIMLMETAYITKSSSGNGWVTVDMNSLLSLLLLYFAHYIEFGAMTSFPRPLSRKLPGPPPRNIHPISYPQKPLVYPSLPSPARPPHFARNWTRSTHLVPAALPRTTPDVPAPKLPPDVGSDRNERVSEITEMVVNARQEHNKHGPLEEERSRKPLWNCINRYVNHMPSKSGKSITLLCAHPNGLNKEVSSICVQCRRCAKQWELDMGTDNSIAYRTSAQ
jgi:hypothetical protein